MSIFDMHGTVVDEYAKYIRSFLSIADERILRFVEDEIERKRALWPEALLQLNPAYKLGTTVEDLVQQGRLHHDLANVFRGPNGRSMRLYQHQQEAIEKALAGQSFVVTSGTGSGKSLTYFIPIMDAVLRGDPTKAKVLALVVYPMNALVNSQYEALKRLAAQYKEYTGRKLPVRFHKYTGQERQADKAEVRANPPHILLTNYMMLELMLVRPEEHDLVDRTTTALKFLVMDELHTYRGRQGADVALLIRRLRERSGNPRILCIGTSATMVASEPGGSDARREAASAFASKLFGVEIRKENVVEESLQRVTSPGEISPEQLKAAMAEPLPAEVPELLDNPLARWSETAFGLVEEGDGRLRRQKPITLASGAAELAALTGLDVEACRTALKQLFLIGSQVKLADGNPTFAFKLHQFISQGETVYATLQAPPIRSFSLEGQYYAPKLEAEGQPRVMFPLRFCRVCGQEYYLVTLVPASGEFIPYDPDRESSAEDGSLISGYLMVAPAGDEEDWSTEYTPVEWLDQNGRVKRDYRQHVPRAYYALPNGSYDDKPNEGTLKVWFQPKPFMLCQNCGEFYTRRDKADFRKLSGLSSEGRSTATTVLAVSALRNASIGRLSDSARKLLSFTDNRQDAALQAGHFNDFAQVAYLRAAIYAALCQQQKLSFDVIADRVVAEMGLTLGDVAQNKDLQPDTSQGREVWKAFRELIEYRVYEDLRRGWRVVQPNLEQCGLLAIEYRGLEELCRNDDAWGEVPSIKCLSIEARQRVLTGVLDHFRRKLAIDVECLQVQPQQQLRKRVGARLNDRWRFDEHEILHTASRFLLPGQHGAALDGMSMAEISLVGRYLQRALSISEPYAGFIAKLVGVLCSHGLLRRGEDKGTEFVQLEASALLWCRGDGKPPLADPIYSRRAAGSVYAEVERRANEFFAEFYRRAAAELRSMEGAEHTAQVGYKQRNEREARFRQGTLPVLFCSPTMELGIDIADLQMVHMRNVPPTPANYAQRSGRAGRTGDPALIMTYCAAHSGHDRYFFEHREDMVAGVVSPPRLDLGNEDLIRAHLHAMWLAQVRLPLGSAVTDVLEIGLEDCPLKEEIRDQIERLSDAFLESCIADANSVLASCGADIEQAPWLSQDWIRSVFRRAPEEFDRAFDRWRELYQAAMGQMHEAQQRLLQSRDRQTQEDARRLIDEANRQRNLLCNVDTSKEESDFYPYRYLASEGFLPGYSFPRLPVRALVRGREDIEFISRPRFLALTEFGPQNVIYHEGAKHSVAQLVQPPGGLQSRRAKVKICHTCAFLETDISVDQCQNCGSRFDASNSEILPVLEMTNVRTQRRERITCDEEERIRMGYAVTNHFRFAPLTGGRKRIMEATVFDARGDPLMRLSYAPAAELYRINHGWRNRREKGFRIDLGTGEWLESAPQDDNGGPPAHQPRYDVVRLFVRDTANLLLCSLTQPEHRSNPGLLASLQYALQRGFENVYQLEETELASDRLGTGEHTAILFWEATEGGAGVLRRLAEEQNALATVAASALEVCHFDPDSAEDQDTNCTRACYRCLLSYGNQRDHAILNRHLIRHVLLELAKSITHPRTEGRDYDEHYRWLRSLTDSRSQLERDFLDLLFRTGRRLPDEAQKQLSDYYSVPDFFYKPNICVFCDGSAHDSAGARENDRRVRADLRDLGYRVVVVRYDRGLAEQIGEYPEVFGEGGV